MKKGMVKLCFEGVFMLLLCMFVFVALLIMQHCCVFVLREGKVKETPFVFKSKFIVVSNCWEVNSQSLASIEAWCCTLE